jgi:hypothetical protein
VPLNSPAVRIDLDDPVVEVLAELSPEYPADTVACLALMVEADNQHWEIYGWREDARQVLGVAIRSSDSAARDTAIAVVHRLAARGFPEFRDLLN